MRGAATAITTKQGRTAARCTNERDYRYVIVGKKTEQSLRRVPLAAVVLPFLPKTRSAVRPPQWATCKSGSAIAVAGV